MRKRTQYFLVLLSISSLSACIKEIQKEDNGCDPPSSNVPFQVIDKTSGEDLFFSNSPKYKLEDLKIYKKNDKTFKEPLRLSVIGTDNKRAFLFPFYYGKAKDTMVVKIADTPADLLYYTVKKPANYCLPHLIEEIRFNDTEVTRDNGPLIFKK